MYQENSYFPINVPVETNSLDSRAKLIFPHFKNTKVRSQPKLLLLSLDRSTLYLPRVVGSVVFDGEE